MIRPVVSYRHSRTDKGRGGRGRRAGHHGRSDDGTGPPRRVAEGSGVARLAARQPLLDRRRARGAGPLRAQRRPGRAAAGAAHLQRHPQGAAARVHHVDPAVLTIINTL